MRLVRAMICRTVALLTLSSLALLAGCSVEYSDKFVTAGRLSTLESIINIHGSAVRYLRVNGSTFKHVQGDSPYFLKVPGEKAIVFVTRNKDATHAFLHLAMLDRPEITEVDLGDSVFGGGIQPKSKPGEYCDWIHSYTSAEIVVVTKNIYGVITTTVDLTNKRVLKVVLQQMDKKGQVVSEKTIDGPQ